MEVNAVTLKSVTDIGALVLLFLVLVGGWKILKPAVDGWLEQYQQLLNVVLELTTALALINTNLEQTIKAQEEISNRLGNHEEKAVSRHKEVMRGLKGKLGYDIAG